MLAYYFAQKEKGAFILQKITALFLGFDWRCGFVFAGECRYLMINGGLTNDEYSALPGGKNMEAYTWCKGPSVRDASVAGSAFRNLPIILHTEKTIENGPLSYHLYLLPEGQKLTSWHWENRNILTFEKIWRIPRILHMKGVTQHSCFYTLIPAQEACCLQFWSAC